MRTKTAGKTNSCHSSTPVYTNSRHLCYDTYIIHRRGIFYDLTKTYKPKSIYEALAAFGNL